MKTRIANSTRAETLNTRRVTAKREPMVDRKRKTPRPFTPEEMMCLKNKRMNLSEDGLKDSEIARRVAAETGRSASTIYTLISRLVKEGNLPVNENKQERKAITITDSRFIYRCRNELMGNGMKDWQIAKKIAQEIGRAAGSIKAFIKRKVREGKMIENRNKSEQREFTYAELALLIRRRQELASKSKGDTAISNIIASEIGRSPKSVDAKIRKMVAQGQIPRNNSNKEMKEFADADVRKIMERRQELALQGMKDGPIANTIAHETGRSKSTIQQLIMRLFDRGKLPANPNGVIRKLSHPGLVEGLRLAPEAMERFGEGK